MRVLVDLDAVRMTLFFEENTGAISNLKRKIKKKYGIPVDEQMLYIRRNRLHANRNSTDDKQLEDDQVMREVAQSPTLLCCELKLKTISSSAKIVFAFPTSPHLHKIRFKKVQKLIELKKKISAVRKISPYDFIFQDETGNDLDEEKNLFQCNLESGGVIRCIPL